MLVLWLRGPLCLLSRYLGVCVLDGGPARVLGVCCGMHVLRGACVWPVPLRARVLRPPYLWRVAVASGRCECRDVLCVLPFSVLRRCVRFSRVLRSAGWPWPVPCCRDVAPVASTWRTVRRPRRPCPRAVAAEVIDGRETLTVSALLAAERSDAPTA